MARPPFHYPDPEIDTFTRLVRGVCGALLGAGVGAGIWLRCGPFTAVGTLLVFAAAVTTCVVGAIRCGDAFWVGFLGRFRH